MSRSHRIMPVAVTCAMLCLSGSTVLAEEAPKTKDLNDYLCKDVMLLSGVDRDIALALMHGLRLGEKKTTQFVIEVLAEDTDKYMDYCLDNPKANALEAFRKFTP
jgi:hypothetical protein